MSDSGDRELDRQRELDAEYELRHGSDVNEIAGEQVLAKQESLDHLCNLEPFDFDESEQIADLVNEVKKGAIRLDGNPRCAGHA